MAKKLFWQYIRPLIPPSLLVGFGLWSYRHGLAKQELILRGKFPRRQFSTIPELLMIHTEVENYIATCSISRQRWMGYMVPVAITSFFTVSLNPYYAIFFQTCGAYMTYTFCTKLAASEVNASFEKVVRFEIETELLDQKTGRIKGLSEEERERLDGLLQKEEEEWRRQNLQKSKLENEKLRQSMNFATVPSASS